MLHLFLGHDAILVFIHFRCDQTLQGLVRKMDDLFIRDRRRLLYGDRQFDHSVLLDILPRRTSDGRRPIAVDPYSPVRDPE